MQPPPPVTRALLIAILAVFVLQQIPQLPLVQWFALFPVQSGFFWPWQVLSYPFLHFDLAQAFFNMLALWMFGVELEQLWGERRYLQYLLACGVAGGVVYLVLSLLLPAMPLFGFAAPIYGLLLAFGLLFPQRPILFFMIMPTTMRTAVILFGLLELVFMLPQGRSGFPTAIAHLAGMLGGYIMILWWRRRPPRFRRVK